MDGFCEVQYYASQLFICFYERFYVLKKKVLLLFDSFLRLLE